MSIPLKALVGAVAGALFGSPIAAQGVDDLVARALEARGGRDALQAIQSVRMTGRMSMGDSEVPIVVEMKRPDRFRVDVRFEGSPSVQAFDGRTAWGIAPMHLDPEALPAEAAGQMADQADFDGPLVDAEAKGNAVELVGRAAVDGRDAWKLRVTRKSGAVEHYFLDARSYLLVRVESKRTIRGAVIETATTLGDYRESGGVLWPRRIRNSARGRPEVQVLAFERIETNVAIDDGRFRMPARSSANPGD